MNIKEQLSSSKLGLLVGGPALGAFFGSSKGHNSIMNKISEDVRVLDKLLHWLLFCKTDNSGNATKKGNGR